DPLAHVQLVSMAVRDERFTDDELHGEVGDRTALAAGGAGVVHLGNTGVRKTPQRQGFVLKTAPDSGRAKAGPNYLQRHLAPRILLFGLVHHSHSAAAKDANDAVAAD